LEAAPIWPLGASVALDGVCLTLVKSEAQTISSTERSCALDFELSAETLSRSTFGLGRNPGERVHLEPSLTPSSLMGGHFVSGHVDAVASCLEIQEDPKFWRVVFRLEGAARERVAPYLVEKGSIAIDGVSLTVNEVMDWDSVTDFSCVLVPHTLNVTKFHSLQPTVEVNLEADLVAKYVARYQQFHAR